MMGSEDEREDLGAEDLAAENEGEMEARLSRALEGVPQVAVADDFARRVMLRVPERRLSERVAFPVRPARVGRKVAVGALLVLVALMLALVPSARGTGHVGSLTVEWLLCVEFIGITLWMSLDTARLR